MHLPVFGPAWNLYIGMKNYKINAINTICNQANRYYEYKYCYNYEKYFIPAKSVFDSV